MDTFSSSGAKKREKGLSAPFSSFLAEDPAGSRRLQSAIAPTRWGTAPGLEPALFRHRSLPGAVLGPGRVLVGPGVAKIALERLLP
jgi:hypothetical protein